MPAIEQNIRLRCVPQIQNLSIVKFLIFLYSCSSILDEVYAQRCISGSATTQLPGYLDQKHVDSSAEHKKAALFCTPGLKAGANTLQNHNYPHMNYLPFLMSKKWEAVHCAGAILIAKFLRAIVFNRIHLHAPTEVPQDHLSSSLLTKQRLAAISFPKPQMT